MTYGNLPYDVRQKEAQKFLKGDTEVLVATDAIGMGMNLPIQRVIFLEMAKFDGKEKRPLKPEEIQQIAGRAGRKGMYDLGLVNSEISKKMLKKAISMNIQPIQKAVLTFPDSLLGIDAPLSEILERWNNMEANRGYKKENVEAQVRLCIELERYTDDKRLIYEFITIPFEYENQKLKAIWFTFFSDELKKKEYNYKRFLPEVYDNGYPEYLNTLEENYKICDLLYFYMDRFHGAENFQDIMEVKWEISAQIINILNQQKLISRKCKECGRILSWNHPYGICEGCYSKRFIYDGWNDMYWE